MSFIRTKEIPPGSGRLYEYEVESYREGGHVKQRHIRYIGRAGSIGTTGKSRINQELVTVYHGTNIANLKNIKKYGLIKRYAVSGSGTPDEAQDGIYVTPSKEEALRYGDGGIVTLKIPKSKLVKDETDSSTLSKDRPPSFFVRSKKIPPKSIISTDVIQPAPAPTTVIKLTKQYPYRVWVEDRGHPLDNRILVVPTGSAQEKDLISLNRGEFVDGVNEKEIMALNDMRETKIGGIPFNAITIKDAFITRPAIKPEEQQTGK